jgi:hypothetical protein
MLPFQITYPDYGLAYRGVIRQFCKVGDDGQRLMRAAMTQLNLSARAYNSTQSVKLSRTIGDLAGSEEIQSMHLAEALHASQPSEVDVELNMDLSNLRIRGNPVGSKTHTEQE